MIESRTLSRREALILLGGATIVITAACGGSSPSTPTATPTPGPTPTPGGTATDKAATFSANHGHELTITGAQLSAGGALNLTTVGSASHTHGVSLTGAQVTQIAGSTRVSTESSSTGGHTHTVTFN
jgi:hypothetical protein